MRASLTNSNDIIEHSASICDEASVDHIFDIFWERTDAIQKMVVIPPETLRTVQTLAESIHNDGSYNQTITNQ